MVKTKLYRPNFIIKDAWLNLGNLDGVEIENPLIGRKKRDIENPGFLELRLMRDPKYLSFATKVLLDIDLLPIQSVILEELWWRPFPMYIASRGFGKSFMLAIYATLKCALVPNTKIVTVGSAFRQSRVIFEYMDGIWKNAPILRSVCSNDSGPRTAVDRCQVTINDSTSIFVPLGDGSKIRGLRAHTIIADEFGSIPPDIYETVVRGFAAVSARPVDNVKHMASRKAMQEAGTWKEADEQRFLGRKTNQCIIAGTADYDFMPYADYWKKYHVIVCSDGKLDKPVKLPSGEMKTLREYYPNGLDDSFSADDYSIIRIPYEMVPRGFMDDKVVSAARAATHQAIYLKEYGACLSEDSQIVTKDGIKNVKDVVIGDMVLTHRGRFRPVTKCLYRDYDGEMYHISAAGHNIPLSITPEHPLWYPGYSLDNFLPASVVSEKLYLASLTDFDEDKDEIDVKNLCSNYRIYKDVIYPCYGSAKHKSVSNKAPKKGIIPSKLNMDYSLGICLGYYMAEGSIGAKGRALEFAMDGHVDKELQSYIDELVEALKIVFPGINVKVYKKKKNTASVTVNSRLVAEIFKGLCPGTFSDKKLDSSVVYAGPRDFRRGIIKGFIHGNGHINYKQVDCHTKGLNLLIQIRHLMSKFNIFGSINLKKDGSYSLLVGGQSHNKLLQILNHSTPDRKIIGKEIQVSQGITALSIKEIEKTHYKGHVFNFEVEEDNSYSTLGATVHNCFPSDSDGFFKRSLIQSCVASEINPIKLPSGLVTFDAAVHGVPGYKYVYGVDPAAEQDNFSIVILELHSDHTRVVYCWSTNIRDFERRKRAGMAEEGDYYGFCARKIRNLMKVFPTEDIAIDAQGGGRAILEAFHDPHKRHEGEQFLWPTNRILDPNKELPTDVEAGLHICHMCQFANFDFTSGANHGTRKDLEDKVLLFPRFDPLSLELAAHSDAELSKKLSVDRLYDTLEDCVMEIEELKDELCTIVLTRTGTGVNARDRWDTPETIDTEGKKRRLRKDRYSALMMANFIARSIHRAPAEVDYSVIGGFAHQITARKATEFNRQSRSEDMYIHGPDWFVSKMKELGNSICAVKRGV